VTDHERELLIAVGMGLTNHDRHGPGPDELQPHRALPVTTIQQTGNFTVADRAKAGRYTFRVSVFVKDAFDPDVRGHWLGTLVIKHDGHFYPVRLDGRWRDCATIYSAPVYTTVYALMKDQGTLGFIDSDGHFTPADDVREDDWVLK
jgi:hypothetical protein